jgi:VanZ family protein
MRTDRFACLAAAAAIMLGLLLMRSHAIPTGWDKLAHVCTFALITALLWHGTAGGAPLVVLGAVLAFGALHEVHQLFLPGHTAELADFLADAAAAIAACGLLCLRRKQPCVELSRRSPAATSSRS